MSTEYVIDSIHMYPGTCTCIQDISLRICFCFGRGSDDSTDVGETLRELTQQLHASLVDVARLLRRVATQQNGRLSNLEKQL